MDRRFLATLALRLLGLFTLLQALIPLGSIAGLIGQAISSESYSLEWVLSPVGTLIALLACGLALLRWAPALAARWVGSEEPAGQAGALTPRALELLGYRLLGAYTVVTNAPSLLSYVGSYIGLASETSWDFLTRELLTAILGTVIGLWLLFGARGLAGLVDRMRGAGLQESEKAWHSPKP